LLRIGEEKVGEVNAVEKKRKKRTKHNFCDILLQGKLVIVATPNNDD
jgi:hypothetical protein